MPTHGRGVEEGKETDTRRGEGGREERGGRERNRQTYRETDREIPGEREEGERKEE